MSCISCGSEPVTACRNEGLGCVLTTLPVSKSRKCANCFNCRTTGTRAHVPIGYAIGGGHGPINRKSMEKMVFTDRFGDA